MLCAVRVQRHRAALCGGGDDGLDDRMHGQRAAACHRGRPAIAYGVQKVPDHGPVRTMVEGDPMKFQRSGQRPLLVATGSQAAGIGHLGQRGCGPLADDLRRVTGRLQQGVGEGTALLEWADLRRAPGITHLVGVLTLAGETTDLDHLVEQEADGIRREAHRDLLAGLERRSQQVWVPVTVATLLPGSLLLLVPFLDALRLFAGS